MIVPMNSLESNGVGSRNQPLSLLALASLLPLPIVMDPLLGFTAQARAQAGGRTEAAAAHREVERIGRRPPA